MLKIKSLSKTYMNENKEIEALRNIDVNINEKEFVVLVGKSGCGKTTLLKCIAGLINPTKGEVNLNGKKIIKPVKDIGFIFQDFSLFPWLTVRENIEFGLRLQKKSKKEIDDIVNYYLNITGLNNFADTHPKNLSGGMKQRVAIARTLANSPKFILMDEPFGSLDNLSRTKMQKFLIELWEREHKTIVFVTHDVEEALLLADKIYVMSKRPGNIFECLNIHFKRPRKLELKNSKEFIELKNKIIGLLEESKTSFVSSTMY